MSIDERIREVIRSFPPLRPEQAEAAARVLAADDERSAA